MKDSDRLERLAERVANDGLFERIRERLAKDTPLVEEGANGLLLMARLWIRENAEALPDTFCAGFMTAVSLMERRLCTEFGHRFGNSEEKCRHRICQRCEEHIETSDLND
jgi:hypothetical protein